MTNPIDIDALRQLMEKATAGPWNHLGYCGQDGTIQGRRQEVVASLSSAWGKSDQTGFQCFANAALIVAAVNALPSLLTELEALRASRGRMVQPAIIDCGLNRSPALLLPALKQAYEKVKEWPERRGDPMEVGGQGFMDLLALRNLVPDIIAALQPAEDCGEGRV